MITLSHQLKADIKALFEEDNEDIYDNDEYRDMVVKLQYELYPEPTFPIITISELNNEDVLRYSNDSGEQVSYLSYQIRIDCEQTANHTALENLEIIGEMIDNLMKSPKYWCMRRVGSFTKQPHYNDNNVMYGYLRYECNVDINTNIIYRRY